MSLADTTLPPPATTPSTVARSVAYAGIDWAEANHAICVIDGQGEPIERVTVAHSKAGIARLVAMLVAHRVAAVGIERPDGPVVDALFAAGVIVYVIAPAQIKALRGRYGSAGNKDDRFDAYVLADVVRTDTRRLCPLQRDTQATIGLRQLCRTRKDLIAARVAVGNQLRAHLAIALPAAVGLFAAIDSRISRAFLTRFATQHDLDRLTVEDLTGWLRSVGYPGRTTPTVVYRRITGAARGATGEHATTLATITTAYLATLDTLCGQIKTLNQRITAALATHPDRQIFTSLPKAGTIRAARLLAEIGDARGRYPTPTALACASGAAPSTRQSGTHKIVTFRWAADKQLRDAVCDFAGDSHHTNPWAADLYQRARNRGHDHPHAVRILARAWIGVIWKCWTSHTPYDPAQHRALQHLLNQDQKTGG